MCGAVVITQGEGTTICAVDNKHGIRSWILLKEEGGRLKVWAVAESDREARFIAGREFQDALARVSKELPGLREAKVALTAVLVNTGAREPVAAWITGRYTAKAALSACAVTDVGGRQQDSTHPHPAAIREHASAELSPTFPGRGIPGHLRHSGYGTRSPRDQSRQPQGRLPPTPQYHEKQKPE